VHDAIPVAGFACPDLSKLARLDELGLEVTGQRLEPSHAVLACRVVEPDEWCRRCGCKGLARDTVTHRLAHEPLGWRPTMLQVKGRTGDRLYAARRMLQTGAGLLTDKQADRLRELFAGDAHVEVEATWGIYQRLIAAYREPDRKKRRQLMTKLIDSISHGVPAALFEIVTLGRTLKKRAADVLAYFDRPGTSNGPTEAINGKLEHLRGSALGFRNLTNYIARSLLETGGFRTQLHPRL
jgi:transposase